MSRRSVASRVFVYDKDLEATIEITHGSNFNAEPPPSCGVQIIRDIEPYRAAASDVASDNKRPVIGSRSRHRAFIRDNGYVEVGNDTQASAPSWVEQRRAKEDMIHDIRRSMGDYGSNTHDR